MSSSSSNASRMVADELERIDNTVHRVIVGALENGWSDAKILKRVNAIRQKYGLSKVRISFVKDAIDAYLDDLCAPKKKDKKVSIVMTVAETESEVSESEDSDSEVSESEVSESEVSDSSESSDDSSEDDSEPIAPAPAPTNRFRKRIVIHIDHDHGEYFDKITILYSKKCGQYAIRYCYDHHNNSRNYLSNIWFTSDVDEVVNYIGSVMELMAIDDMPYKQAEIDIPFFPSIVVKPSKMLLECVRTRIQIATHDALIELAKV